MRADITDDGLVLNRQVAPGEDQSEHSVLVEPAADWLTITVSTAERRPPDIVLVPPSGRAVVPSDFGADVKRGDGYAIVRVARAAPGRWRVCLGKQPSPCVVAAFVTSPLRTHIHLPPRAKRGAEIVAEVRASFDGTGLAPVRGWFQSRTVPHVRLPKERPQQDLQDGLAFAPRDLQASIDVALKGTGVTNWRHERIAAPAGISRVQIELDGHLPGGAPFRRIASRTLYVA